MKDNNILVIDNSSEINIFNDINNLDICIENNVNCIINLFSNINKVINIKIKDNSSFILNHSFINNNEYKLDINIDYLSNNSSVLINIYGVNDKGISEIKVDGNVLNECKNNVLDEVIKIININNGKVICKPNMFIKTNKIIANHQNSISNIDLNEINYLMSKGLDEESSKRLIINGILVSKISNQEMKDKIKEYLNGR